MFRMAGPAIGAGVMGNVGQEGVARRATCSRGAAVRVSDHADHGLGEQQAGLPSDRVIALDLVLSFECRMTIRLYFRLCLARAQEKRLLFAPKS